MEWILCIGVVAVWLKTVLSEVGHKTAKKRIKFN